MAEDEETIADRGSPVVAPFHQCTRKTLSFLFRRLNSASESVSFTNSVSYYDVLVLEKNARVILTDSGGVQKEAFFFKVPCVTLREDTEWVETVETRWNVLAGYDHEQITQAAFHARQGDESAWPYGGGGAAEQVVDTIALCIPGLQ
ncbi:MAG: UDP-N-acetylglucosamine 2-epimerase [Methanothrix sp.]|nr:UDP-N-acetylglucosamine 2-epimerase [Methanothrix sp.]